MPNVSTALTRLGNSNFYNLKDFNQALGNGADATSALNAALAALGTKSGTILIPDGTYAISSQIAYQMVVNQHIVIEGEGNARLVSTVAEPGSEAGILDFSCDGGGTAKLTIRRIKLSHTNSGLGHLDGIMAKPWNYNSGGTVSFASVLLEDVEVTGASWAGINLLGALSVMVLKCQSHTNRNAGMFLTGCQNVVVSGGDYSNNVTGNTSGDYGIACPSSSILPYSKNVLIQGVQANNNGRKGLDVHHGHNIHYVGNTCVGNGEVGIYAVMESATKDVGDITIIGNTIDQTGANAALDNAGIQIGTFGTTGALSPGAFIVTGNKILNVDAGDASSYAIRVFTATSGVAPDRVVISNNTVHKGAGSSGELIFTDNHLAIGELIISHNILHAASCTYGIIAQAATDIVCVGNIIRIDGGSPTYGINLASSANAIVMGNQVNGQTPSTKVITNTSSTHILRGNTQNGTAIADVGGVTSVVDASNHLIAVATGTPTFTGIHANVNTTTTPIAVVGDDTRGIISFDLQTGTIATGSQLFQLNFANAFSSTPTVLLTTGPSGQFTAGFYVSSSSTSNFIVKNMATMANTTGYKISYMVLG